MTLCQHTLAPWNTAEIMRGKYAGSIGIFPPGGQSPAIAILPRGRQDIQEINARLIAAAPEMLAALNRINEIIYAAGAPLGSDNYFAIREAVCDVLSPLNQGASS